MTSGSCVFFKLVLASFSVGLCKAQEPGISLELTDKGLSYFVNLAREGFPTLLNNASLPSTKGSGYRLWGLRVVDVEEPLIESHIVKSRGVNLHMVLSQLKLIGQYEAGYGWFTTDGNLEASFYNFTFHALLSLSAGPGGQPLPNLDFCKAGVSSAVVKFSGNWAGIINTFSGLIESYLRNLVEQMLCPAAYDAVIAWSNSPNECGSKGISNVGDDVHIPEGPFSLNFSLTSNPLFKDGAAILGLNGTILYNHIPPLGNIPPVRPVTFRKSKKMVSVVVTDLVPNTFFAHTFEHRLSKLNKGLSVRTLPSVLSGPFDFFCRGCGARIETGLTEPPLLLLSPRTGVRLNMKGWVKGSLEGFYNSIEMFKVRARLNADVFPYVKDNKVVANTLVNEIRIEPDQNTGFVSAMFGFFMEELFQELNRFLPQQLAPPLESELHLIFGEKGGIPLPAVCGVEFENPNLYYINDALVIDADLRYDAMPTIMRIRSLLAKPFENM